MWRVFGLIMRPHTQRTGRDPVFSVVVTFTGIRMIRAIGASLGEATEIHQNWAGPNFHR